jgi:hypothetical protein
MSHTLFYKITCDQDEDWTRISHSMDLATEVKTSMEDRHAPNTYTITEVELSGMPELVNIYSQMSDITNPASNGEWT